MTSAASNENKVHVECPECGVVFEVLPGSELFKKCLERRKAGMKPISTAWCGCVDPAEQLDQQMYSLFGE